ncbi:1,2-dihydroxy-3-keto-5-methylthiopentene dioxygenase [Yamadazyma tenuis]|uniref:Striatin-domain-containing protein n=1 Tax=Candida tenuis (strain ATCC 10573 / BCRC 21748 / CBS 615 / JCM 9827 / NBRC 10315 / NRRL Y-1498 / VKM Y-70) TaxID=590646 RepID=G3AYW7_CANTC|nr:Striatin-domain-containing protein [Yamadazyma tenuis ATCC 10573]EGV65950.1 Striatin-domain-containing protein [Yamadazyma tenuis ATCC 10573]WEJ95719.1 1,2-dihydroxy-3-keto-5-methylthiopentene dioxygenase [Yamadazyma tenuis]
MSNSNGVSKLSSWQPQQSLNSNQSSQQPQTQRQQNSQPQAQGSPNQGNQQSPPTPLANYTLPGVISYLTSEFTNLERFKIMSNLERSEMKYRITQLQGELNTLKYTNHQQKLRIEKLEAENDALKNDKGFTVDPPDDLSLVDIPEVDLHLIKESRYQLTKSMKEVIHLLKSPVNANVDYLELPNVTDTSNSFDELLSNDNFVFNAYNRSNGGANDDGNKTSLVNKFFNDDSHSESEDNSDPVHSGSLSEKFDKMTLEAESPVSTESLDVAESDTETVILDGSNDFKFNDIDNIEPNIDDEIKNPPPQLVETKLTIKNDEFKHVKVFRNASDKHIMYLHYDNFETPDELRITLHDAESDQEVMSVTSNTSLIDGIEEILELYILSFDVENEVIRMLAVYDSGQISQIVLDQEDSMSSLISSPTLNGTNILSSALVEFDHKRTGKNKSFGLAVSFSSKPQATIKLYDLNAGPRNDITVKEIGSYNKNFFKFKSAVEGSNFKILKWFKSNSQHTDTPKKGHTHSRSLSNSDSSLSPYNLVLNLGGAIFLFNIASKVSTPISDLTTHFNSDLENNNHNLVIRSPIDSTSFQLEIYDLTSKNPGDPNYITCDEVDDLDRDPESAYTTIFSSDNVSYIIEISKSRLKMYNNLFTLLESFPVTYKDAYKVGNTIVLQQDEELLMFRIK